MIIDILENVGFVCKLCDIMLLSTQNVKYIKQKNNEYFFIIGTKDLNIQLNSNLKYILYQLEQLNTENKQSNNLTNKIKSIIKNSIITVDYSKTNIEYYPKEIYNKAYYLPYYLPNKFYLNNSMKEKNYDILFFGAKNERRNNIMKKLEELFIVKYVFDVFNEDLDKIIMSSKIGINIHYYNEPILETLRINQLLCHNIHIISELPCLKDIHTTIPYKNSVTFIDIINDELSNINILIECIQELLKKNINIDERKECINNINNISTQKLISLVNTYLI